MVKIQVLVFSSYYTLVFIGYINEAGILNLERFELFMQKLGEIDIQNFEEVKEDLFYFRQKTGRKIEPFVKNNVSTDQIILPLA